MTLSELLADWTKRYRLIPSEVEILAIAATENVSHAYIADVRGTRVGTVKKQVQVLLEKLGQRSLSFAVIALFREKTWGLNSDADDACSGIGPDDPAEGHTESRRSPSPSTPAGKSAA